MDPPAKDPDIEGQPCSGDLPARGRPLVVGVLGGIAAGKSTLARHLAGGRGRVIDADRLAREVLESPELCRRLAERFGPRVLGPDGLPDRQVLAKLVFADAEARDLLERWTHPAVRARILEELGRARAAEAPIIVLDVPLLLENDAEHGLADECDVLVFVESERDERERRAAAQRAWAPGELARREAAQMSPDRKRARADYVVTNQGQPQELERQAQQILEQLEASRQA